MKSEEVIKFLDQSFHAFSVKDPSRNGLQIQAPQEINKVGFAVDACMATFEDAVSHGVDLLMVHHGLFWRNVELVVDQHYQRLKFMLENNIGLYAMHLPLDAHTEVGNNARLAEILNADDTERFAVEEGMEIGIIAEFDQPRTSEELATILEQELPTECTVLEFGPEKISKLGIVSGGGGSFIGDALAAGCDAFLTGEQEHILYHTALERNISVIMAGHYATETVGVKAVMQAMASELKLETVFIDHPTGL